MKELQSQYSSDPQVILRWARSAACRGIYVPLPGTGGGCVKVSKKDFIAAMKDCLAGGGNLETEYTLHKNMCIYA